MLLLFAIKTLRRYCVDGGGCAVEQYWVVGIKGTCMLSEG